jgi:hypothetical protein
MLQGATRHAHPDLLDDRVVCSADPSAGPHPYACSVWSIPIYGCGISERAAVLRSPSHYIYARQIST